jgi:hypothetical protein
MTRSASSTRRLPLRQARRRTAISDSTEAARSSSRLRTSAHQHTRSRRDPEIASPDDVERDEEHDILHFDSHGPTRSVKRTAARPSAERRSKRARHNSGFYDEESDEDSAESQSAALSKPPLSSRRTRTSRGTKTKVEGFSTGVSSLAVNRISDKLDDARPPAQPVRIPPWTQLPYLIIVRILDHAAHPLDNAVAVRWIVHISRLCRAFAEPAMTVLYASPPLLTMAMAHNFVALMERQASETTFNYRVKVRRLDIDVGQIAAHSYRGRTLDFKSLLQHLPMVTDIELYHRKDMSPFRQLDQNLKWHYPNGLFEGLGIRLPEQAGDAYQTLGSIHRLRSWEWSSRMMEPNMLATLPDLHRTAAFRGLQSIRFINFQLPSLKSSKGDATEVARKDAEYVQHLATSIAALPLLTHLAFESSTVVNELLFPLLPRTIKHLELINCWEVKADDFSEYLLSHGHDLQILQLDHNQSLGLGFLTVLGAACPKLRQLSMDLTYYNHHEFYNDSDPMYDTLLLPGQEPTWPSSLEALELENLRKWGQEAAEVLFQSLVKAAQKLPMLRYLSIKAMLDIPWRQRSQMRNHWPAVLSRVFARPRTEPSSTPATINETEQSEESRRGKRAEPVPASPMRRSNRLETRAFTSEFQRDNENRGLRRRPRGRGRYIDPTDDDTEPTSAASPAESSAISHSDDMDELFVQGLCEIVDIRLDNQKPRERQFGMGDFLDSDNESDEEWNGDENGEEGYAW